MADQREFRCMNVDVVLVTDAFAIAKSKTEEELAEGVHEAIGTVKMPSITNNPLFPNNQ